jgi:hypothetical protein
MRRSIAFGFALGVLALLTQHATAQFLGKKVPREKPRLRYRNFTQVVARYFSGNSCNNIGPGEALRISLGDQVSLSKVADYLQ